jgi:signal transduction histidine kinase
MRRLIGAWRPRLSAVVLGILLTVLALPLVGLFFFRLYENTLIRQTEAELIAQGAALSAIYRAAISEAQIAPESRGPLVPQGGWSQYQGARKYSSTPKEPVGEPIEDYGRYTPIEPSLDLALDVVLPPRPLPQAGTPNPTYMALETSLTPILTETQKITLAGFKLLDPQGVAIAGTQEVGLSLAHVPEVAAAMAGRYASVLRQRVSDQPPPALYSISRGAKVRIFVAMPVLLDQRVAGVVYLSRTPNNVIKHLYTERGKLALAALAMLAVTLLIGFVFVRLITRPVNELLERTRAIAAGDASAIRPLKHHGTKEMAALAGGFLDMARKLQNRSDTLQTFATHVSHELKSPLTSIQGAAELLADGGEEMSAEQRQRFHQNIAADSERLNRLVRRLIELARAENVEPSGETSTLSEAVAALPRPNGLAVHIAEGADVRFGLSAENAGIVFSNLADNSARHGAARLDLTARPENGEVVLVAQDDGSGIAPANRARVFEPFFTTRRDEGGTGMGLGIVAALLKAHGGMIKLVDTERGAGFEMRLPAA